MSLHSGAEIDGVIDYGINFQGRRVLDAVDHAE